MMIASKQRNHWRTLMGALAVAGVAFGLSLRLEGAAHVPSGAGKVGDQNITIPADEAKRVARAAQSQRQIETGEPVVIGNMADLLSGNVPTFPVIRVDYRDDDATRMREAGLLEGPLPISTHSAEGGTAGGCSFDVDCDDGNRCTIDTCDFTPGQPAGSGTCVNTAVPNGQDGSPGSNLCPGNFGLLCGGCDDGLFCNGVETCQGGVCVAGTNPCAGNQVCSETFNMCQDLACSSAADCSNAGVVGAAFAAQAGLRCNGTETCVSGVCVAGVNPCGTGGFCAEKRCSQPNLPNLALVQNLPCLTDQDCATVTGSTCTILGPTCKEGRCCGGTAEPACSRRFKSEGKCQGGSNNNAPCNNNAQCASNNCAVTQTCDTTGGTFYGHDAGTIPSGGAFACPTIDDILVKCPKYGSGIAPSGAYPALLGPISDSPVVVSPFGVPLQKLGDDYKLTNSGVCTGGDRVGLGCNVGADCPGAGGGTCNAAGPSFIALDYLRFAGGSPVTDRISFEFYDKDGNFVEDLFFSGTAAFGIYPVLFDPPINIPAEGFVVQRVAPGFSPDARHVWASTDAVDVGTNSATKMWVNNGPVNSNFGTTGILAYELEGAKVAGNFGACCYDGTCTSGTRTGLGCHTDANCTGGGVGSCNQAANVCDNNVINWVCRGTGGAYQGNATKCAICSSGTNAGGYCRSCSNNLATACNTNSDCPGGTCINDNGDCPGGGTCTSEPACNVGACCSPTTGACTVVTELACTGGGGNYLGNGTDCDADNGYDDGQQHCCPQPLSSYSGADNCEDVILHVITAPPIGETKVVTITGNNSGATNTFANPDSCFDPSDDPNAETGWWEGFTLVDDCTIVYVDHCCTNPVHRPAYRILYDSCPCGTALFTAANPYAFPEPPDARGLPYCAEDDNAWQCFGLLGPGTYYYPIYSALAGHHGDYQFHIVAKACPTAACCLHDQCTDDVTQFQCDALGGFFLAPPNISPAVNACSGTNGQVGSTCFTGSCCTGPGECVDVALGQKMTKSVCDSQQGNFLGNVRCQGGSCSATPVESCNVAADCPTGETCVGDAQQTGQPLPCPVCESAGPGNCQAFDNTLNFTLSDRHLGDAGLLAADDIKPDGDTLTTLCVWGFNLDGDPNAPQADCGPVVNSDHFRVRIYANDGGTPDTGRTPGTLVAERTATSEKGIVPNSIVKTRILVEVYGYQLTLSSPITGLTVGAIYWLEISNDVSDSLATCNWFWMQRAPDSSAYSYGGSDAGYQPGFESPFENVFCTSFNFTPSTVGAGVGSCCTCDGVCSIKTYVDCANNNGVWDATKQNCSGVTCPVGAPANDACANAVTVVAGDYIVNNQCASTDGFGPIPSDLNPTQLDFDLWYKFIAPSSCDLIVSECPTGLRFDSMLAVYHNPGNPTVCPPCPLDSATSAATLAGVGQDESCTGSAVGGPGVWVASEQILRNAQAGECFLLRIGSFPGSRGTANLSIACGGGGNGAPNPVVAQTSSACTGAGVPFPCCSGSGTGSCDKVKFISFTPPNDSTGETAIRVKLTSLHHVSPPYNAGPTVAYTPFEGQSVYVGPPQDWVESSASGTPFKSAVTQCTPHYRDWNTVGLIHVRGSAIVPSSIYDVEHLAASCNGVEGSAACLSGGGSVSAAQQIKTTRWGDLEVPFNPPSATTQPDLGDVAGLVNKFKDLLGAPIKARTLMSPNDGFGNINDATMGVNVGFTHIAACVDAFKGKEYPAKMGKCSGAGTAACTTAADCNSGGNVGPCNLYCP